MTPEAPAAPETPAPEPTVEAVPDAKPEPKPRLLSRGTSWLPVQLTEAEQVAKAKEAASKRELIEEIVSALATAKTRTDAKRKGLEEEVSELLRAVKAGEETREVKIETREVEGFAVTYRLDTGAEVDRRELRAEERQGALPLAPPATSKPETYGQLKLLAPAALAELGAVTAQVVAEAIGKATGQKVPTGPDAPLDACLAYLASDQLVELDPPTKRWRLTMAGQAAAAEIAAKVEAKEATPPAAKTPGRAEEPEEGSNEQARVAVLTELGRVGALTKVRLAELTGLPVEVVSDALADLIGLTKEVISEGRGRGTKYALASPSPKPPTPPVTPSPADPFALAPGPRA